MNRILMGTDDHALLIAAEYRDLNMFRRAMFRLLAPKTARYARWLAANMPAIQTGPPVDTRGPFERMADRALSGL